MTLQEAEDKLCKDLAAATGKSADFHRAWAKANAPKLVGMIQQDTPERMLSLPVRLYVAKLAAEGIEFQTGQLRGLKAAMEIVRSIAKAVKS